MLTRALHALGARWRYWLAGVLLVVIPVALVIAVGADQPEMGGSR